MLAATVCVTYALVAAALLPLAAMPLPEMPAFVSIYAVTVFLADLCTFVLLASQCRAVGARWLFPLAGAFLFSGLMALLHLLFFPGAILPGEAALRGGPMVAWLYPFWGIGFVLLLLWALITYGSGPPNAGSGRSPDGVLRQWVFWVCAVVALLVLVSAWGASWLPPPMRGDSFSPFNIVLNGSRSAIAAAALLLLWRQRRQTTVMHMWLGLALVAAAVSPILTDLGGQRYTFGWYAGRVSFTVASSVLLFVMLAEFVRLQQALSRSVAALHARTQSLETEIRQRELAERKLLHAQKMEAVGRVSGGVAHDFNNLLGVIVANLELILLTTSDERSRQAASRAKEIAFRGGRLTRSLLAFAQKQPLQARAVDLGELLGRFKPLMQTAVDTVEVEVAPRPDTWPVMVDPEQLEIALLNLVINARDAMPDGGVVRIETHNVDRHASVLEPGEGESLAPGDYVAVSVRDTGCGIPASSRESVFEPFFTTKAPNKGTGLGLSQVRGFSRQSGGTTTLASQEGKGTTVVLYLPRATGAAAVPARADPHLTDRMDAPHGEPGK